MTELQSVSARAKELADIARNQAIRRTERACRLIAQGTDPEAAARAVGWTRLRTLKDNCRKYGVTYPAAPASP